MLSAKNITPLVEIIIAVAFFAGASVIIAQIFAKAHIDSTLAHDINNATLYVRECVEQIRLVDYDGELESLCPEGFEKGDGDYVYCAFLDEEFAETVSSLAYTTVVFEFDIDESPAGYLLSGQFACTRKDGTELIRIDTAVFYEFA